MSIDPDPTGLLDKASFDQKGGYNAGGYLSTKSEELIQKGRYEFDQTKRATIYKDWAKVVNDELPYIFCANRQEIWGASKKISGLEKMGPYYNWVLCLGEVTISK
jgi:peptide/nickel transport system substrate-binding protein